MLACGGNAPRPFGIYFVKELRERDAKRLRHSVNGIERDICHAALNFAHVRATDSSARSKFLL